MRRILKSELLKGLEERNTDLAASVTFDDLFYVLARCGLLIVDDLEPRTLLVTFYKVSGKGIIARYDIRTKGEVHIGAKVILEGELYVVEGIECQGNNPFIGLIVKKVEE